MPLLVPLTIRPELSIEACSQGPFFSPHYIPHYNIISYIYPKVYSNFPYAFIQSFSLTTPIFSTTMPNTVVPKTWSTVARNGSPRPTPPQEGAALAMGSGLRPGNIAVSEEQKKKMQDELLLGFGSQFEASKDKSA
ncbi:hypothetical protein FALBO_15682 [Fusarium albosuccineum]|uniref:Uncharacterized protein n=1 Tax=Fusarium albosuccineum TaxID=1237068 RepID=A0A8H4P140_9HYPO|nr:hypothetical protein FALBO_15682 [Fusarium albosuccineum]